MNRIDYSLIKEALAFYEQWGFTYVEAPWIVSHEAVGVTLPEGRTPFSCSLGALVGSAEQAFLQLMFEDRLPPGRYVAAGPCFRDDPVDRLHKKTFFKVEMCVVGKDPKWSAETLMYTALKFFNTHGAPEAIVKPTGLGEYDIELGGIELGSYGHRTYSQYEWCYGTGLAEPRFTMALNARKGASASRPGP